VRVVAVGGRGKAVRGPPRDEGREGDERRMEGVEEHGTVPPVATRARGQREGSTTEEGERKPPNRGWSTLARTGGGERVGVRAGGGPIGLGSSGRSVALPEAEVALAVGWRALVTKGGGGVRRGSAIRAPRR